MPRATVNGIGINYEVEGSGPPLVLLSGLGGNRLGSKLMVPRYADAFTTVIIDNRGTGLSDVPDGPYTIDELANDTAALIDHLGLGPVYALGVSMGASILQSLLINHGLKLRKAVLVSAFPSYTELQHVWLDGVTAVRRLENPLMNSVMLMPWAMTARLLGDHAKAYAAAQMALKDPHPTPFKGFEAQAHGTRNYDSRARLPEVRTPTMVLVGAEDILTPTHQSVEIADLIPGAKLVVMPRGGHGIASEYLDDVAPVVRKFLQEEE
jgi:pimeloyl-ACP methyl ester carboxylesterase